MPHGPAALLALAFAAPAVALNARNSSHSGFYGKTIRQELTNYRDMSFTSKLVINGQALDVIPDTGSFELVIFSDRCASCGTKKNLFHPPKASSAYSEGPHETTQHYGSGQTSSKEAYGKIGILGGDGQAHLTSKQMFWLTVQADLPIAEESTFEGIFGLGAPASAVEMAAAHLQKVQDILSQMSEEDREEHQDLVDRLKQMKAFMQTVEFWHQHQHMRTFSFCLQPESGKNGLLIFNDEAPMAFPSQFTTVPAHGRYWQLPLHKITVQGADAEKGAFGGGHDQECIAIMDTGTSLIGAPLQFVQKITKVVDELSDKWGCRTLDNWPDLVMHLGEHQFVLGPNSYVALFHTFDEGAIADAVEPSAFGGIRRVNKKALFPGEEEEVLHKAVKPIQNTIQNLMPHLKDFKHKHQERRAMGLYEQEEDDDMYCAPTFFVMDGQADGDVSQWLFGLPFFREYYTSFHLAEGSKETESMMFAKADSKCNVAGRADFQAEAEKPSLREPFVIYPQHLRFPRAPFEKV